MATSKDLVKVGHQALKQYITTHNGKIIEEDFTCRDGNIDFIIRENGELRFIDLQVRRATKNNCDFPPIAAVCDEKRQRLERVMQSYLCSGYDGPTSQTFYDEAHINVFDNGYALLRIYRNALAA